MDKDYYLNNPWRNMFIHLDAAINTVCDRKTFLQIQAVFENDYVKYLEDSQSLEDVENDR